MILCIGTTDTRYVNVLVRQFINATGNDTAKLLPSAFQLSGSKWWQPPPSTIAPGKTLTWGSYGNTLGPLRTADDGGCVVYEVVPGKVMHIKASLSDTECAEWNLHNQQNYLAVGWSFPLSVPASATAEGFKEGRKAIGYLHVSPDDARQQSLVGELWKQALVGRKQRQWCHVSCKHLSFEVRTQTINSIALHQCVFTLSDMDNDEVTRAQNLNCLIHQIRNSALVADRRIRKSVFSQCFIGTDFITWLVQQDHPNCAKSVTNRAQAVEVGKELVALGMIQRTGAHTQRDFEDLDKIRQKSFSFDASRDFYRLLHVPYSSRKDKTGFLEVRLSTGITTSWTRRWFEVGPGVASDSVEELAGQRSSARSSARSSLKTKRQTNSEQGLVLQGFKQQYDLVPTHSIDLSKVGLLLLLPVAVLFFNSQPVYDVGKFAQNSEIREFAQNSEIREFAQRAPGQTPETQELVAVCDRP